MMNESSKLISGEMTPEESIYMRIPHIAQTGRDNLKSYLMNVKSMISQKVPFEEIWKELDDVLSPVNTDEIDHLAVNWSIENFIEGPLLGY